MAAGFKIPKKKTVLFSIGPMKDKQDLAPFAKKLSELGYTLYATRGTDEYFSAEGIPVKRLDRSKEDTGAPKVVDFLSDNKIELVINIPDSLNSINLTEGYSIRRTAVDFGISLITNARCAEVLILALENVSAIPCLSMQDMYALGTATKAMQKPTAKPLRKQSEKGGNPIIPLKLNMHVPTQMKGTPSTNGKAALHTRSRKPSLTDSPPLMMVNN